MPSPDLIEIKSSTTISPYVSKHVAATDWGGGFRAHPFGPSQLPFGWCGNRRELAPFLGRLPHRLSAARRLSRHRLPRCHDRSSQGGRLTRTDPRDRTRYRRYDRHNAGDLQSRTRPRDRPRGVPARRDGPRRCPRYVPLPSGPHRSTLDRCRRPPGRGGSLPRPSPSRRGRPLERGPWNGARHRHPDRRPDRRHPGGPPIKDVDTIVADWSIPDWSTYTYIPLKTRGAVPNFARGCPFTCRLSSQWKF